jgi:hypothetical protein
VRLPSGNRKSGGQGYAYKGQVTLVPALAPDIADLSLECDCPNRNRCAHRSIFGVREQYREAVWGGIV